MDNPSLKGRPPYPFKTIGVAVAFSPRLKEVLGEAIIIAAACDARLLLFHAGRKTPHHETTLRECCQRLGLSSQATRIIWQDGNPVPTLLNLCKVNGVDLLILGALRRENLFRYYLGSVARGLSRAAKCSLLLLTEPKANGTSFSKFVICGDKNPKTIHTMNAAVYFGQNVGAQEITVVTELDQPGLAMAMADHSTAGQALQTKSQMNSEAISTAHDMICLCAPGKITIKEKTIPGQPGHAIRQYAESSHADLLVINSPDTRYGLIDRIFPHDLEHILEDLPCSMLIVHSRSCQTTPDRPSP